MTNPITRIMRIIVHTLMGDEYRIHTQPHMIVVEYLARYSALFGWPEGVKQDYFCRQNLKMIEYGASFSDSGLDDGDELNCALNITEGAELYADNGAEGKLCHLFIPYASNGIDHEAEGALRLMLVNKRLIHCPEPKAFGFDRYNTLILFRRFFYRKYNYLFSIKGSIMRVRGISEEELNFESESTLLPRNRQMNVDPELRCSGVHNKLSVSVTVESTLEQGVFCVETGIPSAIEFSSCECDDICRFIVTSMSRIVIIREDQNMRWEIRDEETFREVYPSIMLPDI